MPQSAIYRIILCILLPVAVTAQEKGIHFEKALSWAEVKAKAKAETSTFLWIVLPPGAAPASI